MENIAVIKSGPIKIPLKAMIFMLTTLVMNAKSILLLMLKLEIMIMITIMIGVRIKCKF